MCSFCTAKATHIFFSKKFQHVCVSLDVNFNKSLTNDVVSFEQLSLAVMIDGHCNCYLKNRNSKEQVKYSNPLGPFV